MKDFAYDLRDARQSFTFNLSGTTASSQSESGVSLDSDPSNNGDVETRENMSYYSPRRSVKWRHTQVSIILFQTDIHIDKDSDNQISVVLAMNRLCARLKQMGDGKQ